MSFPPFPAAGRGASPGFGWGTFPYPQSTADRVERVGSSE